MFTETAAVNRMAFLFVALRINKVQFYADIMLLVNLNLIALKQ
jgi:hypothetical protein